MPTSSLQHTIPIEVKNETAAPQSADNQRSERNDQIKEYVIGWRNQLRQQRLEKQTIWNECWALYRGQDDQSNKEDWQSKIVLPKAWSTVKQAVNVMKRLLQVQQLPYQLEPYNMDDAVAVLRTEKMTDLSEMFLAKAHFIDELGTMFETGFIIGLGVMKCGWSLLPRMRMRVQTQMVPAQPGTQPGVPGSLLAAPPPGPLALGQQPGGLEAQNAQQFPTQLPQENTLPEGALGAPAGQPGPIMVPQKQIIREQVLEGQLMLHAVDPYNFYWLPGSKMRGTKGWTGTIEEIQIPKHELLSIAQLGVFDPKIIEGLQAMKLDEVQEQSFLRFGEFPRTATAPNQDANTVKLTEFHGTVVLDGKVEQYRHIIIANDTVVLLDAEHDKWFRNPPYIGFSPLALPFRTEGMGLVEMVRSIDKALNQIVNLGVDTLLFRLLPIFEYSPDFYENAEDIRTGLTPGKILRRSSMAGQGQSGLMPVQFNDVSPGAMQVAGVLDRAHQEGGLVSELQQSLPRWSGAQTATETEAIQNNQNSFFGAMAADIEQSVIAPLVETSIDLIMQFVDTANDPRVANILGVDQAILAGMSQAEVFEMVQGDYSVVVRGLTGQLEKAEMLQNLVQFMNLIGQNPQAWLPWIKQDALLRRILEAFRPHIHDIERIINDPQTAAAQEAAQQQASQQGQILTLLPQLLRLKQDQDETAARQQTDAAKLQSDNEARVADQAIALKTAEKKDTHAA